VNDLKAAVIAISFGPYHFARAKALTKTGGVAPYFIQLARSIATHPWNAPDAYDSPIRLSTISEQAYEKSGYFQLSAKLWKNLDEIDPAVVVTSSYRPFVMLSAARWARSRGRRAVMFFETTHWDRPRYMPIEAAKRAVIRRYYDAAFAGGRSHCDYLLQLGFSRSRIWQPYDVVDNDYFATKAAAIRADLERWRDTLGLPERYFLYVGRYCQEKNLPRLTAAYQIYRNHSAAPWPLVMLGDGPQRSEIERLVSTMGLDGVFLKHFAQIDDLPAYYALAGCLVLPSTVDAWGLVVNEAMACGLPVLVSKLCGCAFDLVKNGINGFVFDPHDITTLADLLGRMSSLDEAARQGMSKSSLEIISAFTPQIWAENLARCITTVVGRHEGGSMWADHDPSFNCAQLHS
jgi:1,2-diacylglycerol 3-alpha-glucosyltransferase